MSNSSIDKATYGAFGIGCMIVFVAAFLLAVAIGIFFGPGWAFLALALFVLSLGLLFCVCAIRSAREQNRSKNNGKDS